MSTFAKLKSLAESRRLRIRDIMVFSANVEEPIVVETAFTFRKRKLSVGASAKQFQVGLKVKTGLYFSVGRPNLVSGAMEPVAKLGRTGSTVFAQEAFAGSARTWAADSANAAIFQQCPLLPDEALHVFRDGLHWVLNEGRSLGESEFSWLDSVASALASDHDRIPSTPSVASNDASERNDDVLPPQLKTLLKRFGHLAEADDNARERMTEEMDAATKKAFLDFVRPFFPLINDYLSSVTTPWPEAAYVVSNLGELASELAIEAREAETHSPRCLLG